MIVEVNQDIRYEIGDLEIAFPGDEAGYTDSVRLIEWSGLILSRSLKVVSKDDSCFLVYCYHTSNYPHKRELNPLSDGRINFVYGDGRYSVTFDLTDSGIKPLTGHSVEWYATKLERIKSFVPHVIESVSMVYKMLVEDSKTAFSKVEIRNNLISLYTIMKYPKSPSSFLLFVRNLVILKHHINNGQFSYRYEFFNNYGLSKLITLAERMTDSEIKKAVSKKSLETFQNEEEIYRIHEE